MLYDKILIISLIVLLSIGNVSACSTAVSTGNFTFQRDSIEPANITISQVGNNIVESKEGFIHTIIFASGSKVGIGGADNPIVNGLIVNIVCLAESYNIPYLVYLCAPLTKFVGGHIAYVKGDSLYYITSFHIGVAKVLDQPFIVTNDISFNGYYNNSSDCKFGDGHHRYLIDYSHGINIYNALDNINNEVI